MTSQSPSYHGYRFPPEIISHAVWLYHRGDVLVLSARGRSAFGEPRADLVNLTVPVGYGQRATDLAHEEIMRMRRGPRSVPQLGRTAAGSHRSLM